VNKEAKKLIQQISVCSKVAQTLETEGWKEIIEPIIDKMITDILGGKIGDTWCSGKLDRAKTEEKREFYIGAKQALIDLIGRIKFHKTTLPVLEERLKEMKKPPKYRMPMEDTKYAPSKE